MTQFLKDNISVRIFWLMMALCILNLSVNAVDLKHHYSTESIDLNEQESLVEIVLEKMLGFEDAIAEFDDSDTEDFSTKNSLKLTVFVLPTPFKFQVETQIHQCKSIVSSIENFNCGYHRDLTSPPPEV